MNPKLGQLEALLKLANQDYIKADELRKIVETFAKIVNELKSHLISEMGDTKNKIKSENERRIKSSINEISSLINKSDDSALSQVRDLSKRLTKEIQGVKGTIPNVTDLRPLEAKIEASIAQIEAKMPLIPEEITGSAIVDKINALPTDDDEDKIDIKHIKGWEKWLEKELAKVKGRTIFAGGGGGSGGRIVKAYDLSSQLDGVTKSFALPAFWRVISVHSSSFPFVLRPTTDYTISGSTITFTDEIDAATTLASGQTLLITYSE